MTVSGLFLCCLWKRRGIGAPVVSRAARPLLYSPPNPTLVINQVRTKVNIPHPTDVPPPYWHTTPQLMCCPPPQWHATPPPNLKLLHCLWKKRREAVLEQTMVQAWWVLCLHFPCLSPPITSARCYTPPASDFSPPSDLSTHPNLHGSHPLWHATSLWLVTLPQWSAMAAAKYLGLWAKSLVVLLLHENPHGFMGTHPISGQFQNCSFSFQERCLQCHSTWWEEKNCNIQTLVFTVWHFWAKIPFGGFDITESQAESLEKVAFDCRHRPARRKEKNCNVGLVPLVGECLRRAAVLKVFRHKWVTLPSSLLLSFKWLLLDAGRPPPFLCVCLLGLDADVRSCFSAFCLRQPSFKLYFLPFWFQKLEKKRKDTNSTKKAESLVMFPTLELQVTEIPCEMVDALIRVRPACVLMANSLKCQKRGGGEN